MTIPLQIEPSNSSRNRRDIIIDEQVDIHALFQQLWSRRITIIQITAAFTLLSVLAVFLWPVTWRAEARLQPPAGAKVSVLEAQPDDLILAPQGVFRKFLIACQSASSRREFFEANSLIKYYFSSLPDDPVARKELEEKALARFTKGLYVEVPKDGQRVEYVSATLDLPDRLASSQLLNAFLEKMRADVRNNLLSDVEATTRQRLLALSAEQEAQEKNTEALKRDTLARMGEAIRIARLLNLRNGAFTAIKSTRDSYPGDGAPPLYLRGYEHLEAEKRILEESDATPAFTYETRELERRQMILRKKLERLSSARNILEVATIDKAATPPMKQLSPRGTIIIVTATLLGFGLALLFFYILDFRKLSQPN
jgi:LPS O-antigen subunit length determinant protein (WzzB/FepE family)